MIIIAAIAAAMLPIPFILHRFGEKVSVLLEQG